VGVRRAGGHVGQRTHLRRRRSRASGTFGPVGTARSVTAWASGSRDGGASRRVDDAGGAPRTAWARRAPAGRGGAREGSASMKYGATRVVRARAIAWTSREIPFGSRGRCDEGIRRGARFCGASQSPSPGRDRSWRRAWLDSIAVVRRDEPAVHQHDAPIRQL